MSDKRNPKLVMYSGDGYSDGEIVYDMAQCPVCGYDYEDGDKDWGEPFCPHCGQALIWDTDVSSKEVDDNLHIREVLARDNYVVLKWASNNGFGEYAFLFDEKSGEWHADSECLDSDDDKEFGRRLMDLFMDMVKVFG